MMTGKEIFERKEKLNNRLSSLLSIKAFTDEIKEIRKELKELPQECSHMDTNFILEVRNGVCPYCGGKIND